MASSLPIVWATVSRTSPVVHAYHNITPGIGLEGHESPYLVGGSHDVILTGHTFSDEPGIYIEGKVSTSATYGVPR